MLQYVSWSRETVSTKTVEDRTGVSEWKLSLSLHSAHRERVSREALGCNRPVVDVGSQLSVGMSSKHQE